jgi:hypothetical protein
LALIGYLSLALLQLLSFAGLIVLWNRTKRNVDDDSRRSRALQFLESKIAVFEDISDRTELQVKQLTEMMENKICDLQRKIDEADSVLQKISQSMKKSIEVAQIFQDKIPHEEILERQNTVKFVKAALLANEGKTVDEIAQAVDLPRAQIEFVVKVNSDKLSFDISQMPEWLKSELNKDSSSKHSLFEKKSLDSLHAKPFQRNSLRPLNQVLKQQVLSNDPIGFIEESTPEIPAQLVKRSIESQNENPKILRTTTTPSNLDSTPLNTNARIAETTASNLAQGALAKKAKDMGIRPVVFPRIEMPR